MARTQRLFALLIASSVVFSSIADAQDPPLPAGSHPRLFMSDAALQTYSANAAKNGTAAERLVARCQQAINKPGDFHARGGSDGDYWPGTAVACAFAYQVEQNAAKKSAYLTQALTYWKASLEDDQTVGDMAGCTSSIAAGAAAAVSSYTCGDTAKPAFLTVTHDDGYPIRWYAPYIALTYDWLNGAPGVSPAFLTQTRQCLTAWVDYYAKCGFERKNAGANYNAGYVIGKVLAAIAIGAEGDGHLWTESIHDLFADMLVSEGLAGQGGSLGTDFGNMVGGDWGEGWQYGPLSVAEYATAARALEAHGMPLPEMETWANNMAVRLFHAATPPLDGTYAGIGDYNDGSAVAPPSANMIDAVLLGPSSDKAAGWARYMRDQTITDNSHPFIWNAIAEARAVIAEDYRTQSPAAPLWYLANGTRTMYMRSGWGADAFWAVYSSPPHNSYDHQKLQSGSFFFSRGKDPLIVEPARYGDYSTLETNAPTADAASVPTGSYQPSQTPWSTAELVWARGTADAAYAAKTDFSGGFNFASTPSDIHYATRAFVALPEGEIVTIDRVHTRDAAHKMYIGFHANTGGGGLTLTNNVASGPVGDSAVAIHAIMRSGGAPAVSQPSMGDCSCAYPCGSCDHARFAVDKYTLEVPGPLATAIHVIDALATGEAPAQVGSLNDDNYDPVPKQNDGVIGAAVYRASKQSFIVASSAADAQAGAAMTYGVPAESPSRHVVFDAPEASDGTSSVATTVSGTRCILTFTAGNGGGLAGHPLMFSVSTASAGCNVQATTDVSPATAPVGGTSETPHPMGEMSNDNGDMSNDSGVVLEKHGCHCGAEKTSKREGPLLTLFILSFALTRRWRARLPRRPMPNSF